MFESNDAAIFAVWISHHQFVVRHQQWLWQSLFSVGPHWDWEQEVVEQGMGRMCLAGRKLGSVERQGCWGVVHLGTVWRGRMECHVEVLSE